MIICPACRESNEENTIACIRCKTDLTPLIRLRELHKLHYNYALERAQTGHHGEALQFFLIAAALNPQNEKSYLAAGKLCAQNKDYETAISYFQKAKEIAPANPLSDALIVRAQQLSTAPIEPAEVHRRKVPFGGPVFILLSFSAILFIFIGLLFFQKPASDCALLQRIAKQFHFPPGVTIECQGSRKLVSMHGVLQSKEQYDLISSLAKLAMPSWNINTQHLMVNGDGIRREVIKAIAEMGLNLNERVEVSVADDIVSLSGKLRDRARLKKVLDLTYAVTGRNRVDYSDLSINCSRFLYIIRKGDKGFSVAQKFYGNGELFGKIVDANKSTLTDSKHWPVNAVIVIPDPLLNDPAASDGN